MTLKHRLNSSDSTLKDSPNLLQDQVEATLQEQAKVVEVDQSFIWLEIQRKSACGSCQSASGCGTGSLSKLFTNTRGSHLKIPKTIEVSAGDWVTLEVDKQYFIRQVFLAYGLPLIGFFVGAMLLQYLMGDFSGNLSVRFQELWGILGALMGLGLGWWTAKKLYRPVYPVVCQRQAESSKPVD